MKVNEMEGAEDDNNEVLEGARNIKEDEGAMMENMKNDNEKKD